MSMSHSWDDFVSPSYSRGANSTLCGNSFSFSSYGGSSSIGGNSFSSPPFRGSSSSAGFTCAECGRTGLTSVTYIDGRPVCSICYAKFCVSLNLIDSLKDEVEIESLKKEKDILSLQRLVKAHEDYEATQTHYCQCFGSGSISSAGSHWENHECEACKSLKRLRELQKEYSE